MKREEMIEKIKERARKNRVLRRDPRFKQTIGLLVGKGFLATNEKVQLVGNRKIRLRDAIWAGQKVEPRILEVLPAAFARLPKRFEADAEDAKKIAAVVRCLIENNPDGPDFLGVPYAKLRVWYLLPLKDQRTKTPDKRKVLRTFRLNPAVMERLQKIAREQNVTATYVLEQLVLRSSHF